ncbi:hypothetical protein ACK2FW_21380 [Clostridioides difficile]
MSMMTQNNGNNLICKYWFCYCNIRLVYYYTGLGRYKYSKSSIGDVVEEELRKRSKYLSNSSRRKSNEFK